MTEEQWGPGEETKTKKAFDTVKIGKESVDLIFGEHPHSRSDNNIYARTKDGAIYGFEGHRRPIKIEIEEYNYLKTSYLSGDEIRKGCTIKIFMDGIQMFDGFHRNYERGFMKAQQFLSEIEDHMDWFPKNPDKHVGRLVAYREQLCVIKRVIVDQACFILETPDGSPFKRFIWEDKEDYEPETYVKVEITSPNLTWFPKAD